MQDFRQTFSTAFRATLFLSIPASVGLFMLAMPFVALLFQRGEFSAQSTAETAWALQFYSIGLFAHSGLEIVTRAFYAMHDTKTPVLVGVGAMGLNIALSFALIAPLAQGGLALANSVATILEMLTLFFILHRRVINLDLHQITVSVSRILISSLAMAAALFLIIHYLSSMGPVFIAILGGLVGAVVYLLGAVLVKSEEVMVLIKKLKQNTKHAARSV